MPVLQFKGKTAVENYHHTVPHHRLEFDAKLSLLGKGEKPSLDGNLIIEGDSLLALKALLPTHAGKVGEDACRHDKGCGILHARSCAESSLLKRLLFEKKSDF